ncbi:MAG TPA: hypothetical protein VLQ20_04115 [Planococcus sp. (in: firmicutes)]|nr:hypothetical protein [Planococcus sp. (in: firmicutes)]
MKKQAIYLFLVSALLLSGCAGKEETQIAEAAETNGEVPAYYEGYLQNPQVTADKSLLKAGQSVRDDKGEIVLNAANQKIGTQEIGGIELTLREAKLFHYKPSYGLIDFYHSYTHDTNFHVVKFFVEIKNTTDQPLNFAPVALLETNAGETKLWEDDIYLEELNGEVAPGETKKGSIGFIVENPDIDAISITTSDLFGENEEKIQAAKKIDIAF